MPLISLKNIPTHFTGPKTVEHWMSKAYSIFINFLRNGKLWYTKGSAHDQAIVFTKRSLTQMYMPKGQINKQLLGEIRYFRKLVKNRLYTKKELYSVVHKVIQDAEPYDGQVTFTDLFHGLIYQNICRRILPELPETVETPLGTIYETIEYQLDFFTISVQNIYYLVGLIGAEHYKLNTKFGREGLIQRIPNKKNPQNYLASFVVLWIYTAKFFHAIVEGTTNDISRVLFQFQTWCQSLNLYDDVSIYKTHKECQRLLVALTNSVMACWTAFLRLPSKDMKLGVSYIVQCGFGIDQNMYLGHPGYLMEPIFPRVNVDFGFPMVKAQWCHEVAIVALSICMSVTKLKLALMNNNTWKPFTEFPSYPTVTWFTSAEDLRAQHLESRARFRKQEKEHAESEIDKILQSLQ